MFVLSPLLRPLFFFFFPGFRAERKVAERLVTIDPSNARNAGFESWKITFAGTLRSPLMMKRFAAAVAFAR